MKKILITGANSYIGTSFENYMKQWPEKYQIDTVDMIDGTWREKDFSKYDTVLKNQFQLQRKNDREG